MLPTVIIYQGQVYRRATADLRPVLRDLQGLLVATQVPYALIGSAAMSAWVPRTFADIDLMVGTIAQLRILADAAPTFGFKATTSLVPILTHRATRTEVDPLAIEHFREHRHVLQRAVTKLVRGMPFKVARPASLAAMKIRAAADDSTRRAKDLADVQLLLTVTSKAKVLQLLAPFYRNWFTRVQP